MDVLGEDKSVYETCYHNMSYSILDLLKQENLTKKAIQQAIEKEFLFGPYISQPAETVEQIESLIDSENLLNDLLVPLITKHSEYLHDFTKDSRLQIELNKSIMNMIQISESDRLGNIAEIVNTMTGSVIEYALQIAVRAVHAHCDIFYALRCYSDLQRLEKTDDADVEGQSTIKESRAKLNLWKKVASTAELSIEVIQDLASRNFVRSK